MDSFVNEAVYMTASVACGWAGAIMQKLLENAEKANAGQTDLRTKEVTYTPRVSRTGFSL